MLAGGVAHDFNNILTTLTGYGTLLQMKMGKDNPLQMYVDNILSASRKGASLTQSLLMFSRQHPIALNPVNLSDAVKGTTKLLNRLVTEDVRVKTVFSGDNIVIMADVSQIDQILFNLATNARDAMPNGGTLTIETRLVELDEDAARLHCVDKPGRYALLSFSDTGVGMNEKTKGRLFEPFFTTKDAGKGTGLGL
jgi:two-component system cell cycle sensor histidine kinase/response regulator CckA